MIVTIDLQGIVTNSSDEVSLQNHLQQLVGQPFLGPRISYGDELTLHFGTPRPYRSPKMKHLVKGSYLLGVRASSWWIHTESPPRVLIGLGDDGSEANGDTSLPEAEFEAKFPISPSVRVIDAAAMVIHWGDTDTGSFGLNLNFSDGASIFVRPSFLRDAEPLADWELFTPHHRVLTAGSGLTWSYLDSTSRK